MKIFETEHFILSDQNVLNSIQFYETTNSK